MDISICHQHFGAWAG